MTSKSILYLDFFEMIGKSKRLLRSGWIREKVKDPESVAEHSFRVGVLAMVLSDKLNANLDKNKLIKMALVHDLGETITGDMVVERWDIVDIKKRDIKEEEERKGIQKIFDIIGQGVEYTKIFEEMIQRNTSEAEVFWQLDKLEMAIQALEYEKEQEKKLDEFFVSVELQLKEPLLKEIFADILKERKRRKN